MKAPYFICSRANGSKLCDLVQQRLALPGRVLEDLVPQVVDVLARGLGRVALGGLDPADLHGQEELGDLDGGEVPADGADAGLSGRVDVSLRLELLEVRAGERRGRLEVLERKGQRGLLGFGKVDLAERDVALDDVGHAVDGLDGGVALDPGGDGRGSVRDLLGERRLADDEAGAGTGLALNQIALDQRTYFWVAFWSVTELPSREEWGFLRVLTGEGGRGAKDNGSDRELHFEGETRLKIAVGL